MQVYAFHKNCTLTLKTVKNISMGTCNRPQEKEYDQRQTRIFHKVKKANESRRNY